MSTLVELELCTEWATRLRVFRDPGPWSTGCAVANPVVGRRINCLGVLPHALSKDLLAGSIKLHNHPGVYPVKLLDECVWTLKVLRRLLRSGRAIRVPSVPKLAKLLDENLEPG